MKVVHSSKMDNVYSSQYDNEALFCIDLYSLNMETKLKILQPHFHENINFKALVKVSWKMHNHLATV